MKHRETLPQRRNQVKELGFGLEWTEDLQSFTGCDTCKKLIGSASLVVRKLAAVAISFEQ